MTESVYDTIVVGMGASGVTAATILAKAGKKVLALEAQDRIGGRINTEPFGDGVVELGAEWIHGQYPSPVYDLTVENNVDLIGQDIKMKIYLSDGTLPDQELVHDLLAFALRMIDDPPEKPEPLGPYITRRVMAYIQHEYPSLLNQKDFITEFLAFVDVVVDNHDSSDSWNDVSTSSKYTELEGHQYLSWHKHGYKTMFDILLNTYKNGPGLSRLTTKLNTEVSQIVWPQDPNKKVVLKCTDGTKYTADNVIMTVSLGVLKERHSTLFSPSLPQRKIDAINNIQIGLLGKIVLLFPHQWWPENHTSFGFIWKAEDRREVTEETWTLRLQTVSQPMGTKNALTLWTSGAVGRLVETLPEELVKRKAMEILRRFMGAGLTIPEPISILRSTWYSNPFIRGSYTYDHTSTPDHPTARADLAEPLTDLSGLPRVLFAGEATDEMYFSTVHGAMDSGKREAARVLTSTTVSSVGQIIDK